MTSARINNSLKHLRDHQVITTNPEQWDQINAWKRVTLSTRALYSSLTARAALSWLMAL
jgi:hypothetical protein